MSPLRVSIGALFGAGLLSLLIIVGVGEFYRYISNSLGLPSWHGVLAAHVILALFLYLFRKPVRHALKFSDIPWYAWLPGIVVLVGAITLARVGSRPEGLTEFYKGKQLFYVLVSLSVIPLLEELVFRCGIGPFIARGVGGLWGAWFSSVIFAVAHTSPTWERLISFKVGLPIGPFLLGLITTFMVQRFGKVWPAVFFHACCNATVYIFEYMNPEWLNRLGAFYI